MCSPPTLALLALLPAAPLGSDEAVELLRESVERTRMILQNPELEGPGARLERLRRLSREARRLTDWAAMARLSAGAQWRGMTHEQRERFTRAFEELLLANHLLALERADVATPLELRAGEEAPPGRRWVVMDIRHRFFPIELGFLISDERRVVDVRAAGFRLSAHARETLRRTVERYGLERTLEMLEQKAAAVRRRVAETPEALERVFETRP